MYSIFLKFYYTLRGKSIPYYARYPLWLILWKPIRKYLNVVVVPNIPFNCVRIFLYRIVGYHIGRNVFIGMKCYLDDIEPKKTHIADNVVISYGCYFTMHGKGQSHTDIRILDGAYLGMRVNVVAGHEGVSIGRGCIVGAGALVIKSIPDGCTAVGVPARVIKSRELPEKGDSDTPCPNN